MVMAYDSQTLLKRYINPNYTLFSIFSTDKQYFITNSTEPVNNNAIDNNIILATEQLGYISPVNTIQQLTDKSTAVTLNGVTGALVTFRLYNTSIAQTDFIMLNQLDYIGDMGNYTLNSTCGNQYADIHIRNITSQTHGANQVIQFVIIKVSSPV